MKTYKKLKKEFDEKVEELRKKCPHKKLSGWCEEWWGIGHGTGFQVKVCRVCNKIVRRATTCQKCGKITEDYVDGNGKTRPMGEYFCKVCDKKGGKR